MFEKKNKLDTWLEDVHGFIELEDGCAVSSSVIESVCSFLSAVYDIDKSNPWHRRCDVSIKSSTVGSILISIQAVNGTSVDIEFMPDSSISLYHYDTLEDEVNIVDLMYVLVYSVDEAVEEFSKLVEFSCI